MNHPTPTTTVLGKNLCPGEWIVVDVPVVHAGTAGLSTGRWPCRILAAQQLGTQVQIIGLVSTRRATISWQCAVPSDFEVETLPKHHAICRKCRQLAPCHDELVTHELTAAFNEPRDNTTPATDGERNK